MMRHRKLEFWVLTGIILFILFNLVQEAAIVYARYDSLDVYNVPNTLGYRFLEKGFRFDLLQHHTYPLLTYYLTAYIAFMLVNFYIYPKLYLQKNYKAVVLLSMLIYFVVVLTYSITDTWHKPFLMVGFGYFFLKNLVLVLLLFGGFVLYIAFKQVVWGTYQEHEAYIKAIASNAKREFQVLGSIWIAVLLLCVLTSDDEDSRDFSAFWFSMGPYAFALYVLNRYWLLPTYDKTGRHLGTYFLKLLIYSFLVMIPFMVIFSILQNGFWPEMFFVFWLGQLLVIGPVSWLVYRFSKRNKNELVTLKKELGRTTADLQFLRSQINPHFLFNALNTLYGTALQENSERTAQGIQMLGDMMRFMLHENHQTKILLSREVEYMRNYIELQSLRTSTSPGIIIQTKIEDVLAEKFIAPMLLIPFVENAFKHGISLKHKSWIRVTLHYEQGKLYFDVYNSTHPKHESDPEKDESGIGLENVQQRLALLYPEKHELIIRETQEEFFVHLTLQL